MASESRHLSLVPDIRIYRPLSNESYDNSTVLRRAELTLQEAAAKQPVSSKSTDQFHMLEVPFVNLLPDAVFRIIKRTSRYRRQGAHAVFVAADTLLENALPSRYSPHQVELGPLMLTDNGQVTDFGFEINDTALWVEQQECIDTFRAVVGLNSPKQLYDAPVLQAGHMFMSEYSYHNQVVRTNAQKALQTMVGKVVKLDVVHSEDHSRQ
jgi:hypothetical protein